MRVSKFSDMIPAVVTLAVFTGALVPVSYTHLTLPTT